jgi:hypothetical protein
LTRQRRWIVDALCVSAIVAAGVAHWPMGELTLPAAGPEPPFWGTVRDALLDGPDAGEWARTMLSLHDGRFDELETHRLPTWLLIVNAVLFIEPEVARAGHLANHLLNIVLGLGVYTICRLTARPWIGLGAAGLAMLSVHALAVSLRFGVDAAVTAVVPFVIVGALLACRRWWLGLASGAIAALVSATHFSTLPFVLPGLALILLCARGRQRWLGALMHVVGVVGTLWLLSRVFPVSSLEEFQVAIANGIAPGYQGNGRVSSWASAITVVEQGIGTALDRCVAQLLVQVRPSWLNWHIALLVPWFGVVGIGLKRVRADDLRGLSWAKRAWAQTDVGVGLALMFCLAPLPVFAAAQAPLRYGDNLSPAGAILLMRGLASLLWVVVAAGRRLSPAIGRVEPWAAAVLGVVVFGHAVQDAAPARRPLYPTVAELGYWQLGEVLRKHFPAGSGVASPIRESLVQGRLRYCPQRICPEEATEEAFWQCLSVMKKECRGDAPVGYVITDADLYDPNAVARRDMDGWIQSNWTPIDEVNLSGFNARVFAIDREEIPALVERALPANDDGSPRGPGIPGMGPPLPDALGGGTRRGPGPASAPTGEDGQPVPGPMPPEPGEEAPPLPDYE